MEYLLPVAASILCSTIGIGVTISGFWQRSRKRKLVGLGLTTGPWLAWLGLAALSPGIDEWNPRIESDAAVFGLWNGDGYGIDLKTDSTFMLSTRDGQIFGKWKRDDWNLYLTGEHQEERYMRFVEDGGKLLLLPRPPQFDETRAPGPIMRRPWPAETAQNRLWLAVEDQPRLCETRTQMRSIDSSFPQFFRWAIRQHPPAVMAAGSDRRLLISCY